MVDSVKMLIYYLRLEVTGRCLKTRCNSSLDSAVKLPFSSKIDAFVLLVLRSNGKIIFGYFFEKNVFSF